MNNNKVKIITVIVIALALFLGGYGAGRHLVPAKVVVTEKVRVETVEKQVVVTKVETEVKVVYVKDTAKDTHTETTTTKQANGVVVTKVVEDIHLKTEVKDNSATNVVSNITKTDDKKSVTEKDKTTTTTYDKPKWSVALLPGYDFSGHSANYLLSTLPVQHLMLGVAVDHRFIGPISLGVWANTSGNGGASVRLEF